MRPLSWQDISVQQYQDVYKLSQSRDIEETDLLQRVICILFNKTEKDVDEMRMADFKELAKQVAFVLGSTADIPGKPERTIKVGGQRYRITYDPTKLRHRQYVELITFGRQPVEQMHLILASLVEPVTWYGKKLPNKAEDHERISSALLEAKVVDVYHTMVFFCKLLSNLIEAIVDSSAPMIMETMKMAKVPADQARLLYETLKSVSDGGTLPKRLPPMKA